jgi:hypothetical protein
MLAQLSCVEIEASVTGFKKGYLERALGPYEGP